MAENQQKNGIDRKYWIFSLKIVGDFGITLALPIVIFSLLGQKLDDQFSTGRFFLVLGFIVSALLSGKIIYKKTKKYAEDYENLDKK